MPTGCVFRRASMVHRLALWLMVCRSALVYMHIRRGLSRSS